MGIDYVGLILHSALLFVSVITFWRAAAMEDVTSWTLPAMWGGLSAVVFLASWLIFGFGWPGLIGGQLLLLLGIGVTRTVIYLRQTRRL